ncbi:glycosyltransferase family 4 protein [Rhizobium sp. BK379]|uniref:glycosyltransferase family 4 protein n=1 Tax=Rhizobium sp. BK379 TaxID=2587059 RepID=UPI00037E3746|nr:glycosyltransferase family 4 protein [Rhizobium sp. BK379]MBB3444201.1 glycosyltransferase involved in cell wall biosynthesis [Rhizobium sp. BK379]
MKIMVWCAARGGMRSVVEAYERDGFLEKEDVRLVASYVDGNFLTKQAVLLRALIVYLWLLATRRVELVHAHSAMRGSFWRKGLFTSIARVFGIPVVLHLHGSEMKPFYESQRPFLRRLIRHHLEKATRVIVLSESWREFVGGIAPAARIVVVPNYVIVPPSADPQLRRPHDLLFLGLIGPRKGTFDLIPAFASIAQDHPDARLVIGGNGQIEAADKLLRDLSMEDRVILAGWVDGQKKEALLETSGIYILPSYNEGLPMSVLEAMAAGVAVITTRVGGIPELITDGVDGLLVDAGDKEGLASAIFALLSDEGLRMRLAQAGRMRVENHYSDRVILPLLHRIYEDASGVRKRKGASRRTLENRS